MFLKTSGPWLKTPLSFLFFQKLNLEKIFIVFMVKDSDTECTTRGNSINPFSQGEPEILKSFKLTPKRSSVSCLADGEGKDCFLLNVYIILCSLYVCLYSLIEKCLVQLN